MVREARVCILHAQGRYRVVNGIPKGLVCKAGGTLNPKGFPSTSFFPSAVLIKELAFPTSLASLLFFAY